MQHLDDALIAEWVDGAMADDSPEYGAIAAHVEQCDECRMRVEEERALAGHVRQLLGVAAPPDRLPPFEEVLHRAGTGPRRAPVRAGPRWMRRLAWAATVVVAGGVGWYARGILIEPADIAGRAGRVMAAEQTTGATGAAERTEVAAEPDAVADLAAARPLEEAAAGRGALVREAPAQVGAARQGEAAAAADEGRREQASTERLALDDRAARRDAAAPAAPPPAAAESRPIAQVAAPAENELQFRKSAMEPWTVVTRAAAEAALGAPLVTLEEPRVVSIELSATGETVRVGQDLGGGTLLELLQSRVTDGDAAGLAAGAVADAEPRARMARAAESTETVVVNGIRVVARAAIPADSLRGLLARVRSR